MKPPLSVKAMEDFGRVRLSKSFFMRDFLFSDIAAIHGLLNVPYDPEWRIDSYVKPKGCLTKPGMANNEGSHESEWRRIEKVMKGQRA